MNVIIVKSTGVLLIMNMRFLSALWIVVFLLSSSSSFAMHNNDDDVFDPKVPQKMVPAKEWWENNRVNTIQEAQWNNIISHHNLEDLMELILNNDTDSFNGLKYIGNPTAKRIINSDLRQKLLLLQEDHLKKLQQAKLLEEEEHLKKEQEAKLLEEEERLKKEQEAKLLYYDRDDLEQVKNSVKLALENINDLYAFNYLLERHKLYFNAYNKTTYNILEINKVIHWDENKGPTPDQLRYRIQSLRNSGRADSGNSGLI